MVATLTNKPISEARNKKMQIVPNESNAIQNLYLNFEDSLNNNCVVFAMALGEAVLEAKWRR